MAKGPDETRDLELVAALVFSPRKLLLARFSDREVKVGSTPDFRVLSGEEIVAFCEVKSPRDDWLDEQIAQAEPGELAGGARRDATYDRVARHIAKAASQFAAVNPDRSIPNVLVFVNHDDLADDDDMTAVLRGYFPLEGGVRMGVVSSPALKSLVEVSREEIDLFVWIDAAKGKVLAWLFNEATPDHRDKVCGLFGIDRTKIKDVPF